MMLLEQLITFPTRNQLALTRYPLAFWKQRTFDTVDSLRLERKLRRIGLSNGAAKLMLSYLSNRRTATIIGDRSSLLRRIVVAKSIEYIFVISPYRTMVSWIFISPASFLFPMQSTSFCMCFNCFEPSLDHVIMLDDILNDILNIGLISK